MFRSFPKPLIAIIVMVILLGSVFILFPRKPKDQTTIPENSTSKLPLPTIAKTGDLYNPAQDTTPIYKPTDTTYTIDYSPSSDSYLILVLGSPFATYRETAEKQFLKTKKLTEAEACKLKVKVGTTFFANPEESGQDYPLSFCTK